MATTPESNIGKSMDAAEARINRGQQDITTNVVDKPAEIKRMEAGIKKAIDGYKQMGIYEGVKSGFVERQLSDANTPEVLMKKMADSFDALAAAESAEAGQKLNMLAAQTYNDLRTLKSDLEQSGGSAIQLAAVVEEAHQQYLPEANFDPSNISETVRGMGELMGQQPNVEKLQGYETENDDLLSTLRLSKNSPRYSAASTEFRYATGGLTLEGVKAKAAAGLEAAYKKAQTEGVGAAKGGFTRAFSAALDLFKMTNGVLTRALFSEGHATAHADAESANEGHETGSDFLSEAEMQMMLGVMMNGVEDKTYFEQLFDAKTALDFYAGGTVDLNTLSPVERQAYALVNGMGKGAAATLGFFAHPWEALTHIAAAGKALLKPSTYTKLAQMSAYTWQHTTALEKNMLIGDLTGQLLGGAGVGSGLSMLLKSKVLGAAGQKLASVSRLTGLAAAGEAIAMAVSPVLQSMPTLAKYGSQGAEIVKNMVDDAAAVAKKWDHFAHKAHEVHGVIDYAETATANTAGVVHDAHALAETNALPTSLPVYAQTATLREDFKIAQANAGKLGLSANEVYQLQSALKTLDAAAARA
jgi:hypothetical protein